MDHNRPNDEGDNYVNLLDGLLCNKNINDWKMNNKTSNMMHTSQIIQQKLTQ